FADTRAELQTVKGKASAATVEAAASARDAAQGKRRLARLVGSSALAERVLRRSEAGRSLAVERAKKLALQLAALSTIRGAGAQAEFTPLGREVSSLGAHLEKATSNGRKRHPPAAMSLRWPELLVELVGTSVDDLLVRLRKEDNVFSAETGGRAGAREYVQVSLGCCRMVDPTKRMQLKCSTSTTRPSLQHAIVQL
ncbi:hypothetical protein T492DRAFT_893119, partial [Pavlovales sp. CCMP2436]